MRFGKIGCAVILLSISIFPSCGKGIDVLLDSPLQKTAPLLSNGNQAAANNSPVIAAFSANMTNPHPGQSVTLTVDASDAEGDMLSYAYAFTAGSGTISGSGASATATINTMTVNTVTVTVTDGKGGQATKTLDLTGANQSPTIGFAAAVGTIWNNGTDKLLTVTANDPDSDALTYSYSLISGAGSITGSTTAIETFTSGTSGGWSTVRVTVSDPYGGAATSDVQIKVCGWKQLPSVSGPSIRQSPSAIYDGSGNMIVFGGLGGGIYYNDVWQYNIAGQTWTQLASAAAPAGREWFAAICDGSGSMIIFGGFTGSAYVNDVWKYTLSTQTWANVTPALGSPSARVSMGSIYDGVGGMIIYSGSGAYASDVWRYSITGQTWTQLASVSAPPAVSFNTRSGQIAIYHNDGINGNMIIFGGASNSTYYNDVWKYTISSQTWANITPAAGSPTARANASAIYDGNGNMIIFGGAQGNSANLANDVWQCHFDSAANSWSWTQLTSAHAPSARYYHSAIYYNDGASGNMIIFGGSGGGYQNDVWMYVLP